MDRDEAVQQLVSARVALDRLDGAAGAMQGRDDYHDAYRAITFAAEALGVSVMNMAALAGAQRRVEDETRGRA